ncbi:MAG: TIGR02449 family protein [Pseudomonadota bacterium]
MTDMLRLTLTEEDLLYLEQHVEKLVSTCGLLQDENRVLRDRQAGLIAERAELIEKTELARTRVESMIVRLKAMETEL